MLQINAFKVPREKYFATYIKLYYHLCRNWIYIYYSRQRFSFYFRQYVALLKYWTIFKWVYLQVFT